ncbi:MAG TPA: peptide deformylase, partial [Candidatus Hydrogenedentes bacterium]|nr:peptide deformylase [Candidatus Hydrogenedentota bacterium]
EAKLAADMLDTMHAYEGVGLAGPQVGVGRQIITVQEPGGQPRCLLNPDIVLREGQETGEEGCLSFPELYAVVPRAERIRVIGFDEKGASVEFEAAGMLARIIQHEVDHLSGVVFIDRLDVLSRQAKLEEWNEMRARMAAAIRKG